MNEVTKRFLAAKALIRNSDGNFLIVREAGTYDEGTNVGKWDLPGGRLEVGETLLEGLQREVREEAGIEIVVEDLVDARENFPVIKGEKVHIVRLYYLCSSDKIEITLSVDHDQFAWISKAELSDYAVMDDVKDLISTLL